MKTRFAPSPTGYLHLGNLRTALFCALLAKNQKGHFLLRIEDTDRTRSSEEFSERLQHDLKWMKLTWDEGPYYQSQRQPIYDQYYEQLIESGAAYPCFCSDQQLAIARKVQLSSGQPPRYSGACRKLSSEQIKEKIEQGMKPTYRFRVPDNEIVSFVDFARGEQIFKTNDIGDFIIRRGDGTAPFFFCNAIDDALMEITHVLRGEDHLTNTPRQILILKTLHLFLPQYGHMPLIVGNDGSPLSKRHGSRSIKELHELGYLPLALQNYLARLGHYYTNNEFMNTDQLAEEFLISHLGNASAHFDPVQLLYWQKQGVLKLTPTEFWEWCGADVQNLVPSEKQNLFIHAVQPNAVFPADVLHWAHILFTNILPYNEESLLVLQQTGDAFFQNLCSLLEQHGTDFKLIQQGLQNALGIKGKALFQPLRVALTGQHDGPEMAAIFNLLGVERIQERLKSATKMA